MKNRSIQSTLATVAVAAMLFTATACNSEQSSNQAAGEEHAGHGEMAQGASVMEVPDFTNVAAETKTHLEQVYQSYLATKEGMVADNAEAVKKGAQQVLDHAQMIDAAQLTAEQKAFFDQHVALIRENAGHMTEPGDLDRVKEHFATLSSSTFALVKAFGANTSPAYYQFCPMANDNQGAYWISDSKEIRNPYFSQKMLKCGENKETLTTM
jgi:hypothetical protein